MQNTYLALTQQANNKSALSRGTRYHPDSWLPEQTATVARDSSGPLPSAGAPKQWNGTETLSSLHQDLLSRRDTLFTAGAQQVPNLQGGGSDAAKFARTQLLALSCPSRTP